jgi:hypothetical protein
MWFIATRLRYHPPVASLLKTAVASAVCGLVAFWVTARWHSPLGLVLAVAAATAVFLAAVLVVKPLEAADTHALWQIVSRFGRPFRRVGGGF